MVPGERVGSTKIPDISANLFLHKMNFQSICHQSESNFRILAARIGLRSKFGAVFTCNEIKKTNWNQLECSNWNWLVNECSWKGLSNCALKGKHERYHRISQNELNTQINAIHQACTTSIYFGRVLSRCWLISIDLVCVCACILYT